MAVSGAVLGSYDVGGLGMMGSGPKSSAFLLKYSADGKPQWEREWSSAGTATMAGLASDRRGNLIGVGSFSVQEVDQAGQEHGRQVVMAELSSKGNLMWSLRRRLGTPKGMGFGYLQGGGPPRGEVWRMGEDRNYSAVAVGTDGSLFAAGDFSQLMPDEGSDLSFHALGGQDGFISKYSFDGQHRWTKQIGGMLPWREYPGGTESDEDHDSVTQVVAGPGGAVAIAGVSTSLRGLGEAEEQEKGSDLPEAFLAALDGSGGLLWSLRFPPEEDPYERSGIPFPKLAGSLVGVTFLLPQPRARAFSVQQYDWLGKVKWRYLFSARQQPWIQSIEQMAASPDGTLVFAAIVHGQGEWAGHALPTPSKGGVKGQYLALLWLSAEGHPAIATTIDGGEIDQISSIQFAENGELYLAAMKRSDSNCFAKASIYKVAR